MGVAVAKGIKAKSEKQSMIGKVGVRLKKLFEWIARGQERNNLCIG